MNVPCVSVTGRVKRFHEVTVDGLRCTRCGLVFMTTTDPGYVQARARFFGPPIFSE